jgi:GTP-binding protein
MVRLGDERSFVMADLPGIIEGASQGLGLGLQFLRHIERCRVIVHVIDMAGSEGRDPLDDFEKINAELKSYKMNLMKRPMIVAANKMDLDGAEDNLKRFKEKYPDITVYPISAYTHQNLDPLLYKIADTLEVTEEFSLLEEDEASSVVNYTFREEEKMFEISKDDAGRYIVTGKPLERIVAMLNLNQESAVIRFTRQLRSFGVDDALRKAGCKDGDIVRVLDMEFEFRD